MKKLFFMAIAAMVTLAVNAQQQTQTQNPPQTPNCCNTETDVELTIHIAHILCLEPSDDYHASVSFNCRSDFNDPMDFKSGGGSSNFGFKTWSNVKYNVGLVADRSVFTHVAGPTGPTYFNFPLNNVEWRVTGVTNLSVPPINPLVFNVNYNNNWKDLSNAANVDNVIKEGPNGYHGWSLNFRTKPITNGYAYAPGVYYAEAEVNITEE